jgi:hypothetical protein
LPAFDAALSNVYEPLLADEPEPDDDWSSDSEAFFGDDDDADDPVDYEYFQPDPPEAPPVEVTPPPAYASPDSEAGDDPRPRLLVRSWEDMGLPARPNWWHYWEERNEVAPPNFDDAPVHDAGQELAAADAAEHPLPGQDEAEAAELPPLPEDGGPLPNDDDSPTWASIWSRRRAEEAWRVAEEMRLDEESADDGGWAVMPSPRDEAFEASDPVDLPSVPFTQEDFFAPPLRDGPWNKSSHVSALCKNGFSVSVDITKRGRAPPLLVPKNDAQRAYLLQLESDGIWQRASPETPVLFCCPHFFIHKPGKLRLINNARKLNEAVKKTPQV